VIIFDSTSRVSWEMRNVFVATLNHVEWKSLRVEAHHTCSCKSDTMDAYVQAIFFADHVDPK
jgi:hypothetical protein